MKAEELMRFDWVHLTDDDTPRQVDWIRSGEVGLFWGQTVTPPYLEPIPLTAEILEKNGWKEWFEHSTIARSITVLVEENTNLCIQEIDGQDSMFIQLSHCGAGSFEFRKHLKYVHELQHLFRLVGLTDLANNFKV